MHCMQPCVMLLSQSLLQVAQWVRQIRLPEGIAVAIEVWATAIRVSPPYSPPRVACTPRASWVSGPPHHPCLAFVRRAWCPPSQPSHQAEGVDGATLDLVVTQKVASPPAHRHAYPPPTPQDDSETNVGQAREGPHKGAGCTSCPLHPASAVGASCDSGSFIATRAGDRQRSRHPACTAASIAQYPLCTAHYTQHEYHIHCTEQVHCWLYSTLACQCPHVLRSPPQS